MHHKLMCSYLKMQIFGQVLLLEMIFKTSNRHIHYHYITFVVDIKIHNLCKFLQNHRKNFRILPQKCWTSKNKKYTKKNTIFKSRCKYHDPKVETLMQMILKYPWYRGTNKRVNNFKAHNVVQLAILFEIKHWQNWKVHAMKGTFQRFFIYLVLQTSETVAAKFVRQAWYHDWSSTPLDLFKNECQTWFSSGFKFFGYLIKVAFLYFLINQLDLKKSYAIFLRYVDFT